VGLNTRLASGTGLAAGCASLAIIVVEQDPYTLALRLTTVSCRLKSWNALPRVGSVPPTVTTGEPLDIRPSRYLFEMI
jgi:hypothetical protein